MEKQLVIFTLGEEHYGVDISTVESTIKMQPITCVPRTPDFVEGVTNLRGKVLPVIDLRKRFGLPAKDLSKESRIIVTNINQTEVGMIVDGVSEVLNLPDGASEPPPSLVSNVDAAFISGIAKIDQRLVILLDLNRVLSTQENARLAALPAAA